MAGTKSLTVTAGASSLTGLAAGSSTTLNVNTGATTNKGLLIQAVASQSADLVQIQDSTSAVLEKVDSSGRLFVGGGTAVTSNFANFNVGTVNITANSGGNGGAGGSGNADLFVLQASSTTAVTIKLNGNSPDVHEGLDLRTNNDQVILNAGTNSATLQLSTYTGQANDLFRTTSTGGVLSGINASGGLYTNGTTNTFGNLAVPAITSPSTTGTNFYYELTATNAAGETIGSNTLAMNANTSVINWTQVPGATGYKLYRNSSNTFNAANLLIQTITNGTTVTLSLIHI